MLDEAINLSSTNRGFRTINHMVATYEQTKKGLGYFYPERQVQDDGIHTKLLNLQELMQSKKLITSDAMYYIFARGSILLVFFL